MITRMYKIKLRESFEGRGLKPSVDLLDNQALRLGELWTQDEDDPYPGEVALGAVTLAGQALFQAVDITWLSSGDTEDGKA